MSRIKPTGRMLRYARENYGEVMHTTLNPEGPGVVRIHLIPPKYSKEEIAPSVAIINGQDIIPVNPSWSILLSELIKEINRFSGREVSSSDVDQIIQKACRSVRKVFPFVPMKWMKNDIFTIMNTFKQVAYHEPVDEAIHYMSIGDYADYMQAPHRMDLMVSAMTKDGKWHCSQKCLHCYAAGQAEAEEEELGTAQWKQIIDRCREACIPQLTFTGGEPTMREDLVELVAYASWFVTRLNTNGIRLTEDLCAALREASLDSVQITFYSDDPAVHNRLVGASRYEDTVRGIEHAVKAGLSVSVNTPLCTLNRDYVKTLRFLKGKGITYVTCSGLITTGNALTEESEQLQLETDEIRKILKDAVEFCYANGMEISFTSPGWIEDSFFKEMGLMTPGCGACLSNMAVTPGGNVVPCQSWLSDGILGNMLTDSWETIWNSSACRERREHSALMLGDCPLRRARK